MNDIDKAKGWIGVFLQVWPVARIVLGLFGVELPDLGVNMNAFAAPSIVAGSYLLASTDPIVGRKKRARDRLYV